MAIATESCAYYFLNQTLVDPDVSKKHLQVIRENAADINGNRLFTITFRQVLQDFMVRNWNGRIYTKEIVMEGINSNPLIQHDIKMGTWTGEYGHPIIEKGMNELARQMTIFPPNACWTIDKYWEEGNLLMGECTTLAGGYGDMVRDRVLTGYPAQASSRSIGGVDKNGYVLRGYTPITFDCVIRPSHKIAYMDQGSTKMNFFPLSTGQQNTMSEAAVQYNYAKDPAFRDFLLSENSSKQQISMLCDTFRLDYDSMTITENAVILKCMDETGYRSVILPMNQLINAEYYNLFS